MTISYVQSFQPLWYIVGLDGLAAGGAQMFTYDSLTRLPKAIYQDPAGLEAYPNPFIFELNGTGGPFYWQQDSSNPGDQYYFEIYDAQGNLLEQANNFPASGSGGGGDVTTYISITNYIANNQFIDNIGAQAGPLPTNLLIAPSNHKGFTPAQVNPLVGTFGVLGPDIRFVKNNTNAVDSLSFPDFVLASAPLTGDVTPVRYIRYQCTNEPAGEVYKSFQFPITQKVKNLSNQIMTFGFWGAVTSTARTLNIYCRQYYGSGTGATPEVQDVTRTLIGQANLTSTWTWFPLQFTVPSVAAGSLGTPGLQTDDDAIYVQIDMPLGEICDILFTKPALFLGAVDPDITFDSYDMIDSIDQTPRTGATQEGYLLSAPLGWLSMDDGTIGNTGSGSTHPEGAFNFQLYTTLYTSVANTQAPVSGGRTPPGNDMDSAITDFLLGKTLQLPLTLGRALASSGSGSGLSARILGQTLGTETNIITAANLPNPLLTGLGIGNTSGVGPAAILSNNQSGSGVLLNGGGNVALNNMQPTTFMNVYIKL